MTRQRILPVNVAKDAQITLKVGYEIVTTPCYSETLFIAPFHPHETIFVFWFVNEE
jgi:hypothetical protein